MNNVRRHRFILNAACISRKEAAQSTLDRLDYDLVQCIRLASGSFRLPGSSHHSPARAFTSLNNETPVFRVDNEVGGFPTQLAQAILEVNGNKEPRFPGVTHQLNA